MKREKLVDEIEELKKQREFFELEDGDYAESFDDLLDEEGDIVILGMHYCRSTVLKEIDPVAYRCCLSDYLSSIDVEDDPKYQALCEQIEELEYELEQVEEDNRFEKIVEEWAACDKIKIFEFAVIDKRTGEKSHVTFDIDIKDGLFVAQHEPLNDAQAKSGFIASVRCEIDPDFTLDENLLNLFDACQNAIAESEFFAEADDE